MNEVSGTTAAFKYRSLEFHSSRMWQWAQVDQALSFMRKFGLNTLIFHQNDIVDQLVFPTAFFPDDVMWKRWPVRLHSVYQNRHYINKVVREAARLEIGFFVEIKEIWFVDALLERVAGLRNEDGIVCPSNPFWWEFLDIKMRELIAAVPGLSGVIVSPGTRESKTSISTNSCRCARCLATDPTDWYTSLLGAMHRPLAEHGKTLVVRDFSYSADQQSRMLDAAGRCSNDIVISLKNTPHDYYPTFPDNPRIGHTSGMRQWVEYDTWGQFFGMGFFPVGVVEDMQKRMRHALDCGVEGISLRTDWEVITDSGSFNSPNVLNVVAGALLAQNVDISLDEIYADWARHGVYSPMKTASELGPLLVPEDAASANAWKLFMRASWSVMERAAYIRGHLFHEDNQYPETVAKAFDMLIAIHGRDDWEPGASRLLDPTDANLAIIFAEKADALREVATLADILAPALEDMPAAARAEFQTMLELYVLYVQGYALCASAVFLVRKAEHSVSAGSVERAQRTAAPLRDFSDTLAMRLHGTSFPHYVYWLLDGDRTRALADDVERRLAELSNTKQGSVNVA
jgi:hypothetical protein